MKLGYLIIQVTIGEPTTVTIVIKPHQPTGIKPSAKTVIWQILGGMKIKETKFSLAHHMPEQTHFLWKQYDGYNH